MRSISRLSKSGCLCALGVFVACQPGWASTFSVKAVKINPVCTAGLVGEMCARDADCHAGAVWGLCGGDIARTNNVTLLVGDTLLVEVFVSDWSPEGQDARAVQAHVDRYSFFNGGDGGVLPIGWDRGLECSPCRVDADCPLYPNELCHSPGSCYPPGHDPGAGAFIDMWREDFIHRGFAAIRGIEPCQYIFQSVAFVLPGPVFDGEGRYLASLLMEVAPGSAGVFDISLIRTDPVWGVSGTKVMDRFGNILLPLLIEPLTVTINNAPIVCGDGVCEGEEDRYSCLADCGGEAIPTVSAWSLVVMVLLLVIGARIGFGRSNNKRVRAG